MAALQKPWTPASHGRFPPAFRAAAKALLLVAHRGAAVAAAEQEAGVQQAAAAELPDQPMDAALLAQLPEDALLHIIRQAAYPLSAWQPAVDMERAESMAQSSETYQVIMAELEPWMEDDYEQEGVEVNGHGLPGWFW